MGGGHRWMWAQLDVLLVWVASFCMLRNRIQIEV